MGVGRGPNGKPHAGQGCGQRDHSALSGSIEHRIHPDAQQDFRAIGVSVRIFTARGQRFVMMEKNILE
jgi:hypothetical protein